MSLRSLIDRVTAPRTAFALVIVLVVLSYAAALYLQHVVGLAPCPLCVVQRIAFIAAALMALLGLVVGARRVGQMLFAALALLCSLAGAGVAAWHSWIVAYPPPSLSCGRPFQWFHDDFPLAVWLPKIFRGNGDCLQDVWYFLGLNVPNWSLLVLLVMAALMLAVVWRAAKRR